MRKMPFRRLGYAHPAIRPALGIVLCVCFIALALSAETFAGAHAEHDCYGEGCPVCLQIQWARDFSRQFRHVFFHFPIPLKITLVGALVLRPALMAYLSPTSVNLKVKMNE
jgi:hypothetical protein